MPPFPVFGEKFEDAGPFGIPGGIGQSVPVNGLFVVAGPSLRKSVPTDGVVHFPNLPRLVFGREKMIYSIHGMPSQFSENCDTDQGG